MKISVFIFFFFTAIYVNAQEILAVVRINAEKVQTSERQIFKDLENNILQFLNTRRWTNDKFTSQERIKMNLDINLTNADVASGVYFGTVLVSVARPVYGSSYETQTISFFDKNFNFSYVQNQTIEFNDNAFLGNLGALLAFYAYVGLGMDYDSFSKLGGSPFFEKANQVAINAQTGATGDKQRDGWAQFGSDPNSRFALIENLMSSPFKSFREAYYTYHRLGLDKMSESADDGRGVILNFITNLKPISDSRPNSCLMRTFFNTKDGELVNIFREAQAAEKSKVVELLKAMDPSGTDTYEKILK